MIHAQMTRLSAGVLIGLALTGCTTLSGQAPTCDGASRRPLNRSLWDWERGGSGLNAALGAPSTAERGPPPQADATDGSGPPVASARPPDAPSPAPPIAPSGAGRVGAVGPARIDVAASLRACGGPGDIRHG